MLTDLEQIPLIAWTGVALLVLVSLAAALAVYLLTYPVRSQLLGKTIYKASGIDDIVALTFDDGPSIDTISILDFLRSADLKATFFLVGSAVEAYPDIARKIVRDGHAIGNHSYSHPIFLFCSPAKVLRELTRTQKIIRDVTGVTPRYSRPPCGVRTPGYFAAARKLGLETIQWSDAGFDWKKITPNKIAGNILATVRPGSIILLHDGDSAKKDDRKATVEALPILLKGLEEKGLSVAPIASFVPKHKTWDSAAIQVLNSIHGDKDS